MLLPTVTGSGLSVKPDTLMSAVAGAFAVVVVIALLFAGVGSHTPLATEALFATEPALLAVTTIVTIASAPLAIGPRLHVTVWFVREHVPLPDL